MAVRIVPESTSNEGGTKDYVQVSTCNDPLDDTVTLATIRRFVARNRKGEIPEAMHVKTLVLLQPMSPDAAIGFATSYAERKNISLIYLD